MKSQYRNTAIRVLAISVLCIVSQNLFSQSSFTGQWLGKFMGEYKTQITLRSDGSGSYTGTINMWADGAMIQDDALTVIQIENKELTFYIQAKETHFKGEFSEDASELSGNFTFPDKSLHPISMAKVTSKEAVK